MANQALLPLTVTATSDASGNITFAYKPVGPTLAFEGTLNVPGVSAQAQFTAYISSSQTSTGAQKMGYWSGSNTWGPLQLFGNQTLVIVGSHVAPSTLFQCLFLGRSIPQDQVANIYPLPSFAVGAPPTATGLLSTVTANSAADGTITLNLGAPPAGSSWVGTVVVPGAPGSAVFSITVGGVGYGSWQGAAPFGPIDAMAGQAVVITGVNLSASTSYTANFIGQQIPVEQDPGLFPTPVALTPPPTLYSSLVNGAMPVAGQTLVAAPGSGKKVIIYSAFVSVMARQAAAGGIGFGEVSYGASAGANTLLYVYSPTVAAGQYGQPAANNVTMPGGFPLPINVAVFIRGNVDPVAGGVSYSIVNA